MEVEAGEPLPNGEGSPSHQDMQENRKSSNEKDEKKEEKDEKKEEKKDGKNADVEMEDASVPKESPQKEKNKDQELDKDVKPDTDVQKTIIDKELLKAYRYFDRDRTGYIKLDDLRRILHSLGKLLSDKNLRELTLCALFESNKSPRSGRILYTNLVKKVNLQH